MTRHPGKVYGASKGSAPGQKQYYRKVYSGGRWDEFLKAKTFGTVLQVCCGGSRIGDIRVDIDPLAPGVNLIADMLKLPIKTGAVDCAVCDPIYSIGYPERIHLQRELARVARRRIIFKGPWIPRATGWILVETVLQASDTCANVSVLSVLDKAPEPNPLFNPAAKPDERTRKAMLEKEDVDV